MHRRLPSQKVDQRGYAANRRQSAAWMKENADVVIPRLRPLRYSRDPDDPPREKGIDVELAIAAVELVLTERCDVAVVFSHDTDLMPAIELLTRLRGSGCVETVSWTSPTFNRRLRSKPAVFQHLISEAEFVRVEDRVNDGHQ